MKSSAATSLAESIVAAVRAEPPLPESPDDIPDGTTEESLDRWIMIAERNGRTAEREGNLQAIAQMGRLTTSLLEAKRKNAPLPTPDANDSPDMVRLGADVAARVSKLVADAVKASRQ